MPQLAAAHSRAVTRRFLVDPPARSGPGNLTRQPATSSRIASAARAQSRPWHPPHAEHTELDQSSYDDIALSDSSVGPIETKQKPAPIGALQKRLAAECLALHQRIERREKGQTAQPLAAHG